MIFPLCGKKVAGYSRYTSFSIVYDRIYSIILITAIAAVIGALTACGGSSSSSGSDSLAMPPVYQAAVNKVVSQIMNSPLANDYRQAVGAVVYGGNRGNYYGWYENGVIILYAAILRHYSGLSFDNAVAVTIIHEMAHGVVGVFHCHDAVFQDYFDMALATLGYRDIGLRLDGC